MCKCQWRPELTLGWCSPGVIHLVFWDRTFYWDLNPLIVQSWLASGLQSPAPASAALMLQVWIPTDAKDPKSDSHACVVWWFEEDVLHRLRLLNTLSSVGDHAWVQLGSVSWLKEVRYWGQAFRVKIFAYCSFALSPSCLKFKMGALNLLLWAPHLPLAATLDPSHHSVI